MWLPAPTYDKPAQKLNSYKHSPIQIRTWKFHERYTAQNSNKNSPQHKFYSNIETPIAIKGADNIEFKEVSIDLKRGWNLQRVWKSVNATEDVNLSIW